MVWLFFSVMIFRRFFAAFLVFLFVVVAIPTFFIYAFSRTFFSGSFYQSGVTEKMYEYLVNTSTHHIYGHDITLQKYFGPDDIRKKITEVFTPEIFSRISYDFGTQIENLKTSPDQPATLSLKILRESLLTVTHNLAYHLFAGLPVCKNQELPEINQEGIPTCVPKGLDYANISAPLSKQFEKAVYTFLPEQVQIDLISNKNKNTVFYIVFSWINHIKIYLLGTLVLLMAAIALVLYYPISLMVRFEAFAFLVSGFLGVFLSFLLKSFSSFYLTWIIPSRLELSFGRKDDFLQFLEHLFTLFSFEVQKISFVFLILGVSLFFMHMMLKRKRTPSPES